MTGRRRWQSLTCAVHAGALTDLVDDQGGLLVDRIRLILGGDWVADPDQDLSWSLVREEGLAQLRAEWQFDGDELRLVMVLSSQFTAEVAGPELVVESSWPSQRVSVGSRHSAVLIDALRPDGAVMAIASRHRAGDWSHPLDGSPMQLTSSRLPRQLVWQATLSAHTDALTGLVPAWLPRLMVDEGDEVEIALPDAGVVAETLTVVTTERGVAMALPAGRHRVVVHQAQDSAEVSLWGRPLDEPVAVGAVGRALQGLASNTGEGLERAEAELEEALHSTSEVSPLLVAATAALLSRTGADSHRELLLDVVPRMAQAPGRVLAQVRAAVALALTGDRASAAAVQVGEFTTDDLALQRCLSAELAVLTGATEPTGEVRSMCALWGRGLPVDELAVEWVAPWLVVWRHAPESWRLDHGWLLDQAEVAEWAQVRLRLDSPADPAIDWLLL